MARRATSLGPKPSLFVFCFVFVLFFVCFWFFCCFFGGFKGQVRWPEGPPHLALNPPYLFFLFVFFWFSFFFLVHFLSLFLIEKPCFPPKKGHLLFFLSVSLSFSLAFFRLPLFHFLFLCLSVFLFFLPSVLSFFFASFLFLVLVSFFLFLSSVLLFLEKNNIKIFN